MANPMTCDHLATFKLPPLLTRAIVDQLPRETHNTPYGEVDFIPYSRNEHYLDPYLRIVSNLVTIKNLKEAKVVVLKPGQSLTTHTDKAPYGALHLVLQTNTECRNVWDTIELHMEEGGLYWVDPSYPHQAANNGPSDRAHLMILGEFEYGD